jgi:adenine specific DNA methylase Mod
LHCDPTVSHYIKVMMDGIFGHQNFRNEIIWKRTSSHSDARRRFGDQTDIILFYSKGSKYQFEAQYVPYPAEYLASHYGKRRLTPLERRNPRRPEIQVRGINASIAHQLWQALQHLGLRGV